MKLNKLAGLCTLGSFASATLFASATVQAQESEVRGLEEIVVTAAYREQGLQDVPVSISAVTGDTPPQSSMPASSRTPKSSERLGGACRWIDGGRTSRAAAIVQRYSSGGQAGALRIPVRSLGRKFWMITS